MIKLKSSPKSLMISKVTKKYTSMLINESNFNKLRYHWQYIKI